MGVAAIALAAVMALPATSAFAARPLAGSPKAPVLDDDQDEVVGQSKQTNFCGAQYCRTYLTIEIKDHGVWKTYDWVDISNLYGDQFIVSDLAAGKNSYRTAVLDFASYATPDYCGPATWKIAGVTYKRWACDGQMTTYLKSWRSSSRSLQAAAI